MPVDVYTDKPTRVRQSTTMLFLRYVSAHQERSIPCAFRPEMLENGSVVSKDPEGQ